jgi:hypothetical protein
VPSAQNPLRHSLAMRRASSTQKRAPTRVVDAFFRGDHAILTEALNV